MKPAFYGKKMFVADLILVSIWAFFFSRYCSTGLLLLIPIRVGLCFEMQRKSPWTLVSAVAFLLAYSAVGNFDRPFARMFFNFFCAIGESELMIDIFSKPLEWEMEAWIGGVSALWFIWLVVLPVVVGILQRRIKEIQWKKKGIWIYLIPLSVLCVWIMFDEGEVGAILWGLFIACLPIFYWTIYRRNGRSLVQLIISDRQILWYVAFVTFMLSAFTIGLKDISSLKLIGLLTLPPLFYIMLVRVMRLGVVLTRCCVALSLAGWLYWLSLDVEEYVTIIMLCVAVGLAIYVGVTMIVRTRRWVAPAMLMLTIPVIIAPGILGLNPYVVTDADYTRMYVTNLSVRNGVYVVEKGIAKDKIYVRRYGLRDRYGLILPMKYTELKPVDRWGRFLAVNAPVNRESLISSQCYGIFDLRNRKFVIAPENIAISQIEKIDDMTFKLINPDGRYFATLYMPGEYRSAYSPDAHVEPHFAEGETSVNEFLGRIQNINIDIDNKYWRAMRKTNPHAYRLLVMLSELGGKESSPVNDLNFAKAIRDVVNKDSYYRGNMNMALDDIDQLSETITDSGSQTDINIWTDYLRLTASVRTSLAYDGLMNKMPDNKWINREYVAWHNLIEAMAYYLDYLYSAETYRAVPEEKNMRILGWLNHRRVALSKEQDILSGNLVYSVDPVKSDSIKTDSDFDDFFSNFHSYSDPYYYNPMWNEIKAAFDEWVFARTKIAEELEPDKSLSYKQYSREVIDSVFSDIKELDFPGFRPALY